MEEKELTFWEHLEVLRWALVRIIVVLFVLAIGYFIAMPYIFDKIILAPCHNDFIFYEFLRKLGRALNLHDSFFTEEFDVKLININLAAPFFVHLTTSGLMAVVTATPYLFFEIWKFIRPALYPKEFKGVRKALLLGTFMFFIGVLVGYFMIYPMTLRFLATYELSSTIETQISLNSYIDNFMMLVLCMGLAFELPLVTWLLSLLGLITKGVLREYRKHAFVVIVIAAAIITPTGDPFTLTAVTVPLYLLYELSILMIKDRPRKIEDEDDNPAPEPSGDKSTAPISDTPQDFIEEDALHVDEAVAEQSAENTQTAEKILTKEDEEPYMDLAKAARNQELAQEQAQEILAAEQPVTEQVEESVQEPVQELEPSVQEPELPVEDNVPAAEALPEVQPPLSGAGLLYDVARLPKS